MEKKPGKNALWRNRDFHLLWSGQFISTLGTNVSELAMPLLVLALTRSPAQAGLIAAAQTLPYLVIGLPAGALVDRWNRKTVMVVCDITRCLAFGSVPLSVISGHLTIAQLYLVALIQGTTFVFFNISEVAALPHVVSATNLAQATGINSAADEAGSVAGPGLGGFLISLARTTTVGAALAYLVDSLSYLVSVVSLALIRTPFGTKHRARVEGSLFTAIKEGACVLWSERRLRIMALLALIINFFGAPLSLAVIVLARGPLHLDFTLVGLIFSVEGLSGVIGSLLVPWLKTHLRSGTLMLSTLVGQAVAAALLALAATPVLVLIGVAVGGPMAPIYGVVVLSYRLHLVSDELQGRVTGVFRLLIFGGQSIGVAAGGILLGIVGPRAVLWLIAIGMAGATCLLACTEVRRAE